MPELKTKRAYQAPDPSDGKRILVDALWPRGISKIDLRLDHWWKELAPSTELRQWFHRDREQWDEFKRRYAEELAGHEDAVSRLRALMAKEAVTLVYSAKDEARNNAVVLKEFIENGGRRD